MKADVRSARLAKLRVPTLVIHGLTDPLMRPEHGRALAMTIPDAKLELVLVERMGHALPERAWAQITHAIGEHATR
jgi:pimeloyl-ACP methyl ester carboxylesterase